MITGLLGKGVFGTVRRASLLPIRYGVSPERILSRLQRLVTMVDRWECKPTIPVTASLLERYPTLAHRFAGADLAIHGYRHVSYLGLSTEEKRADLDSACRVFESRGIVRTGFRAPYLQIDDETLALLRRADFTFDSSTSSLALPEGSRLADEAKDLAISRYGRKQAPQISSVHETPVEIPVSLPDDEILIDGLGLRNPTGLWHAFEAMMQNALSTGSHLVLQVHPERFHIYESALELLLERSADCGAWVASLSSVADWLIKNGPRSGQWPRNSAFAFSVTGDLDAVSIRDFATRTWGA